jgi:hypothetical protein
MSKRLQVLVDEAELEEIQEAARRHGMTVAEWVRGALRRARKEEPMRGVTRKLEAVRLAARHDYPTADIDRMLEEIEQGYAGPPPA